MTLLRRILRKLQRMAASLFASGKDDYASRYKKELANFAECATVHDLPAIFQYWSEKYLDPKLNPFGITEPEQFFFLYAQKFHERFPATFIRMVSIGCGNADMEVRLARRLVDCGITTFTIECMDINSAMMDRGRELATAAGVMQHLTMIVDDFNYWRPQTTYDLVLANQCLHHVVKLEHLFAEVKNSLNPDGYFLVSDMIGRNGHQRWPEAMKVVNEFWHELPDNYRHNRMLHRHEPSYINHDCATEGFEGIRAQDIMPLLISNFQFELFIPFANVVYVFIDRPFGHNFNADGEWDRNFIDRVHARDEEGMLSGELKPTQMLAVLRVSDVETQLLHPTLTPEFCVRHPDA